MSQLPADDPILGDARSCEAIEKVIVPRSHDLGGFQVRRALPAIGQRMVGPFIFFDQMGPAEFHLGEGLDVRPHPHIGLSTVTYLFDGEIMHRDSLGTALAIKPGAVNLMTAGRGIVHSERTGMEARATGPKLYGIQAWLALPKTHEEVAPEFKHHGAGELPRIVEGGKRISLIMGSAYGQTSPVKFPWDALYAEAVLSPGAILPLDPDYDERAIYIVSGKIDIAGDKTAVYISHRLSSCKFCDDIAVFDHGAIVRYGTHDQLVADENGKYYELWHAQAQYYVKE